MRSTKTFAAMPRPNASLEPLTQTSIGPLKGADRSTFTIVPGVSPMSKSLWRTLCPPLMKEIFAETPALTSHIETRFWFRFPTSSKPFLWSWMHSSHDVNGRLQAGMILPSSGQVSGCFRKRHSDSLLHPTTCVPFHRLENALGHFECVERRKGIFQAACVFGLLSGLLEVLFR
jgi:hypothetical protein